MITEKVKKAVERASEFKPLKVKFPAEIKIETQKTDACESYLKQGWKPSGDRSVEKTAETALDII